MYNLYNLSIIPEPIFFSRISRGYELEENSSIKPFSAEGETYESFSNTRRRTHI